MEEKVDGKEVEQEKKQEQEKAQSLMVIING